MGTSVLSGLWLAEPAPHATDHKLQARSGGGRFLDSGAEQWENEGGVKVRDVIRLLEADGWRLLRTKGSHRQFRHGIKPMVVTVPGKPGDDLPTGTLKSVLKKAGLEGR